MPALPFVAMTLWPTFRMFEPPAPPTAFMPFPALLLIVLFDTSTSISPPIVESVFNPPPVLSAMVTPLNVAVTLPPAAAGFISTPAPLFDIRLLVMTRFNGPFGVISSATPVNSSKTQSSKIKVPLPVTVTHHICEPAEIRCVGT